MLEVHQEVLKQIGTVTEALDCIRLASIGASYFASRARRSRFETSKMSAQRSK